MEENLKRGPETKNTAVSLLDLLKLPDQPRARIDSCDSQDLRSPPEPRTHGAAGSALRGVWRREGQ